MGKIDIKEQKYKKVNLEGEYQSTLVLNGSITLESALVLPVFMIVIMGFVNFMGVLNYQNIMQNSVIQAAKSIGRYTYVINRIGDITESGQVDSDLQMDNDILISGINIGYAWKEILTEEVKSYAKKVNVYGGYAGISIIDSKINKNDEGINDIKVNYRISMDFLGGAFHSLRLSNRCYFRSWTGVSIVKKNTGDKINQTVYITRTGDVYHLTDTCTYIKIAVAKVKYSEISNLRNETGAKYRVCTKCADKQLEDDDIIFITASGTKYHCDSKCSKIKRDVIPVDISQTGNRKLCNRCGKEK